MFIFGCQVKYCGHNDIKARGMFVANKENRENNNFYRVKISLTQLTVTLLEIASSRNYAGETSSAFVNMAVANENLI